MMPKQRTVVLSAAAALSLTLAGCGGGGSHGPTTDTAGSTPSATTTPPARATPPASSGSAPSASTSPQEHTYHGRIGASGLTCLAFAADDGTQYALTGPAVTAKIRALAHSGRSRSSLHGTPGPAIVAQVTVVGYVEPHAMNTCSFQTLVASKITIVSSRTATAGPPLAPA